MTLRRPLVLVSGQLQELPLADAVVSSTYVHDQPSASDTWTITHGLGKYPSVSVVDSAGTQVQGGVAYVSVNELVLTFSSAFSGKAFLN